jgi:hypothetical protein
MLATLASMIFSRFVNFASSFSMLVNFPSKLVNFLSKSKFSNFCSNCATRCSRETDVSCGWKKGETGSEGVNEEKEDGTAVYIF